MSRKLMDLVLAILSIGSAQQQEDKS